MLHVASQLHGYPYTLRVSSVGVWALQDECAVVLAQHFGKINYIVDQALAARRCRDNRVSWEGASRGANGTWLWWARFLDRGGLLSRSLYKPQKIKLYDACLRWQVLSSGVGMIRMVALGVDGDVAAAGYWYC